MYNNDRVSKKEDDLKFIPLNITETFTNRGSAWFPVIDMSLPTFGEIPNSFALNFAMPMDNSKLQINSLNTLDYIQNDNINIQNNNQEKKQFEQDFDLEYPSETLGEELISYNKEEKCKKKTSNNSNLNNPNLSTGNVNNTKNGINNNASMNNASMNNASMNNASMNNASTNNASTNNNGMSNNGIDTDVQSNINKRDFIEEPIHMELLRNLNFENYLNNGYRGESINQLDEVDRIFSIVKSDNSIIDTFKAYNIPRPIYELIIKKIISLSLENLSNKWEG